MDIQRFLKNRRGISPEELAKYAGRYVAWDPDGTQIIASDEDELRLDAVIKARNAESLMRLEELALRRCAG